jgi:hypothetical protein
LNPLRLPVPPQRLREIATLNEIPRLTQAFLNAFQNPAVVLSTPKFGEKTGVILAGYVMHYVRKRHGGADK